MLPLLATLQTLATPIANDPETDAFWRHLQTNDENDCAPSSHSVMMIFEHFSNGLAALCCRCRRWWLLGSLAGFGADWLAAASSWRRACAASLLLTLALYAAAEFCKVDPPWPSSQRAMWSTWGPRNSRQTVAPRKWKVKVLFGVCHQGALEGTGQCCAELHLFGVLFRVPFRSLISIWGLCWCNFIICLKGVSNTRVSHQSCIWTFACNMGQRVEPLVRLFSRASLPWAIETFKRNSPTALRLLRSSAISPRGKMAELR